MDRSRRQSSRRFVSLQAAAIFIDHTEKALRKLVERRKVPFRRNGRRLLFVLQELEIWFHSLPGVTLEEALVRNAPTDERRRARPDPQKG
jgi:hypothetical protein